MKKAISASHTGMMRYAVLSISLIITTGPAVSSALPLMAKNFPNISLEMIDMIATVQQFTIMLFLLISGTIAKKIGIKRTIALGLMITGVAGIFPVFSQSFEAIFISRLLLGIGIGLFNSLAITVIDLLFSGHDKAQMLGNRSAMEQLGVCILNLVVGLLLLINWHMAFLIYGLAFPIMIFFWRYVPEPQIDDENKEAHQRINLPVVLLALLLLFLVMCSTAIIVQIPSIIVRGALGSATTASLIISLNTLAGMAMGFLFGRIYKVARYMTLPIGTFLMALGAILIGTGGNLYIVSLGTILCGFSYPLAGTYAFNLLSKIAPAGSETLGNSVLLIGCNLGSFISPIGVRVLAKISGNGFIGMFIVLLIVTVGIVAFQWISRSVSKITKA
ncbi:MFS transporter [Leuconostoc fallax]|uniref:Major facilitator superfamily (MFS) profile domain-containing protein n=2 Tax=Leuconostoc fallax TaxID=1251 RepID=A0A4R5N7E1_9LACO|nr:MFS transporter [Leuconostoc fallax]MBU7455270.1 MFS transporter [Leuconostoc fallax]MCO6183523.1 MFS transporter [Leuconostoc fallax]TDG67623.1 hypothetical protein C5L23_001422 [Leuconostoc fallax]